MGFRIRKSIKVAPGIRLNLSKTGIGTSVGGDYGRVSVHSSGRNTFATRTGMPGITYMRSIKKHPGQKGDAPPPPPLPDEVRLKKPGIFAPAGEKALYAAVMKQDRALARAAGDEHAEVRLAGYTLAGLWMMQDDPAQAMTLLQWVMDSGGEPANDAFVQQYLATSMELGLAEGVTAEFPICREAVGLSLAELLQDAGRVADAINLVEGMEPTGHTAVSLAELYVLDGDWQQVIALTEGLANQDDATALLLAHRGVAFRETGVPDAAIEAFKLALRAPSRSARVRHLALIERARTLAAMGRKAPARKDVGKVLAEDSTNEAAQALSSELSA
jgi:tetratricopeptide (TPR) repeat protein